MAEPTHLAYEERRQIGRRTEDLLPLAVRVSPFSMTLADATEPDLPLTYVNQAFVDLTGYSEEEAIGRNCRFLQGPETSEGTVAGIRQALSRGEAHSALILNYRKDGTKFWNRLQFSPVFDETGVLSAYMGIQINVTDGMRSLRVEQEQQKMETLGRMAGGVAHELNNALQPIKLLADLLQSDLDALDDPRFRALAKDAARIGEHCDFAADIVDGLLAFVRGDESTESKFDAHDIVRAAVAFAREFLPATVSVDLSVDALPPGRALIQVNAPAFMQVFTNLFINADQAMGGRGAIAIDVRPDPRGDHLAISVRDTGPGIPERALNHLFEPFFTTKEIGQGTGLGLSVVYGIIESWDGTITAANHDDGGALFRLTLPMTTRRSIHDKDRRGEGV